MRLLAILAALLVAASLPAAELTWEKIEGCTLVANGYRDGDSFLVRTAPKTLRVFRLFFVDACEDTADQRYPKRIAQQAAYFGITSPQVLAIGDKAAEFTTNTLSAKPFAVWTLWQDAAGSSTKKRFYAIIMVGKDSLADLLVKNGLARIYGKRVPLPDGTTSRDYLDGLAKVEAKAKADGFGGWMR